MRGEVPVDEDRALHPGKCLLEKLESLGGYVDEPTADTGDVAARVREACDETRVQDVIRAGEDDRGGGRYLRGGGRGVAVRRADDVHADCLKRLGWRYEVRDAGREVVGRTRDDPLEILALAVATFLERLQHQALDEAEVAIHRAGLHGLDGRPVRDDVFTRVLALRDALDKRADAVSAYRCLWKPGRRAADRAQHGGACPSNERA